MLEDGNQVHQRGKRLPHEKLHFFSRTSGSARLYNASWYLFNVLPQFTKVYLSLYTILSLKMKLTSFKLFFTQLKSSVHHYSKVLELCIFSKP